MTRTLFLAVNIVVLVALAQIAGSYVKSRSSANPTAARSPLSTDRSALIDSPPPVNFARATTYGSGGDAQSVAVADVNGDGKLDSLVANGDSQTVGVLLGNGDGTFQAPVIYPSGGSNALSIAVADLNGDGKPDLVVANGGVDNTSTVGVLIGNGDGTFQAVIRLRRSHLRGGRGRRLERRWQTRLGCRQ
jgi:hypothetical protein